MSIEDGLETAAKELPDVTQELPVDGTSTEQPVAPQQPTEGGGMYYLTIFFSNNIFILN